MEGSLIMHFDFPSCGSRTVITKAVVHTNEVSMNERTASIHYAGLHKLLRTE